MLRCKKAEECHCPWKLCVMVVKDTSLFAIIKYNGSHTCFNPPFNRDHQQLDYNLVATHIEEMIKAQFTLSVVAIQASIMEKFGYEILYKKALLGKHLTIICKTLRYFTMFSRCFMHLLKDSIIVDPYSVLKVHICMRSMNAR